MEETPSSSDDDSSASSSGPALPRGVLKTRAGWAGEELEREHSATTKGTAGAVAAVDLSQFRNTEVGKGYQARHVIRQRTAADGGESSQKKDMAQPEPASLKEDNNNKKKKIKKRQKKEEKDGEEVDEDANRLSSRDRKKTKKGAKVSKYLESQGIREFRKELESIVSSS